MTREDGWRTYKLKGCGMGFGRAAYCQSCRTKIEYSGHVAQSIDFDGVGLTYQFGKGIVLVRGLLIGEYQIGLPGGCAYIFDLIDCYQSNSRVNIFRQRPQYLLSEDNFAQFGYLRQYGYWGIALDCSLGIADCHNSFGGHLIAGFRAGFEI